MVASLNAGSSQFADRAVEGQVHINTFQNNLS